ncbi:MAG TPA: hypothetical protein DEO99_06705 [Bacteroidetes bacterium]|nr:hypothetical protein [Bacteroidota bacterium]
MKRLLLTAALFVTAQPLMAQDFQPAPKRGLNLARETAVASNGGLGTYHPARCMYANSVDNPCLRVLTYGYEYRFLGGPPGWEVLGLRPTVESTVLISPNGQSVIVKSNLLPY